MSDGLISENNNSLDSLTISGHSKITVGVPVYFFFQLNSDRLVDESQIVNLDDIANISKAHNFKVDISGAADSATGTQSLPSVVPDILLKFLWIKGYPKVSFICTALVE